MKKAICSIRLLAAVSVLLISTTVHADGPANVAKADHALWQQPINTKIGFDKASRASILLYVGVLKEMQKKSDAQMMESFKIKSINRASVEKWIKNEEARMLVNYRNAAQACSAADWTCLNSQTTSSDLPLKAAKALQKTPANLAAWRSNLTEFSRAYISEQLRLAALFPKVTSEIDTFSDQEWTGDTFSDRQFFLSFDDGPTAASGVTDDTLQMLAKAKKNGVFFVLGENLNTRASRSNGVNLQTLYKNQCLASHGWQHQSHAKWAQWQDSIQRTDTALKTNFSSAQYLPYFRPPYGQRKADSGDFFKRQGLQVALWNIDSQDWNASITASDIYHRMISLMLIKRRGMLLFHDVHPKAKTTLPVMFESLGEAVSWGDCRQLNAS
jgi:peptidoglycan-N-acetylglucosamine deacetylase